jgi:NAD(P)-dependent dehydrogenase (short-subunit alcohol dehydrogenase family)
MNMPNHHLAGRVVIVTGAGSGIRDPGSGIGRATAIAFAQAGAHVLGVGRREANLHQTARAHPPITAFVADICADGTPATVINEAIDRWGRVDVLVNNAGATAIIHWLRLLAPALRSYSPLMSPLRLLARAALPYLRDVHGSIVNVSSTFGHRPLPGGSHYAPSKSAIEMVTQSCLMERCKSSGNTYRRQPMGRRENMRSRRPASRARCSTTATHSAVGFSRAGCLRA